MSANHRSCARVSITDVCPTSSPRPGDIAKHRNRNNESGYPDAARYWRRRHVELVGFKGGTSFSAVVRAEMTLLNYTFRGQFLLIDQEWGIIGRNVLNALSVLFDGPRQVWEERLRQ